MINRLKYPKHGENNSQFPSDVFKLLFSLIINNWQLIFFWSINRGKVAALISIQAMCCDFLCGDVSDMFTLRQIRLKTQLNKQEWCVQVHLFWWEPSCMFSACCQSLCDVPIRLHEQANDE